MTKPTSITLLAALAVGLIAAIVTWFLNPPVYSSTASVRINYKEPTIRMVQDRNLAGPMYDVFMQSLTTLISSQRIIDMAVKDPVWKSNAVPLPLQPSAYFGAHLRVTADLKRQVIQITDTDENPQLAATAVRSVTKAFTDLYTATESQMERQRMGLLQDQRKADSARIEELKIQQRDALAKSRDDADQTPDAIAERQRAIEKIEADLTATSLDFVEVVQRIDAVRADLSNSATLISEADVPTVPIIDHRIPYAAIAGGDGFLSTLLISVLISRVRPRRRTPLQSA